MFWGTTALMRMWQAGLDLARTNITTGETAVAAGTVIGHRAPLITAAVQTPWLADYEELNRIAPEKIRAFTASGAAVVNEGLSLQRDIGGYFASVVDAMFAGWLPTSANIVQFLDRSVDRGATVAARVLGFGGVALGPIHRVATANAQRLGRNAPVGTGQSSQPIAT
jgi:hypothetical protein